MNESDASVPTTASDHQPAAPAADEHGRTDAQPAAAGTPPEQAAPSGEAVPPEAPVEINPAAEPPADEPESAPSAPVAVATVEPSESSASPDAAWAVEVNPAAEPEQVAEIAPAAEPSPTPGPVAAVEAVATVEPNPAAEPDAVAAAAPAAEGGGEAAPAAEAKPAPKAPPQRSPEEIARAEERRQRAQQAWERVVAAKDSGEILSGTVTAAVKGGLLVDAGGIRGFLPASQVRVPLGTAIETLVKTKVPLKVIDVDTARRRIVVSHRRAAEEERRGKRAELLRSLAVGQMREGVVVRIAEFGAFVDLGGVDGLIPMRELAFERIDKASDVVKIGEQLQVEVLRIDENGKKISLSRKNALPDPWRDHADVLRQGQTVEGKVIGKEPRLLVEIAPGVVGSVRESDADPADYEIGEGIEVMVRRADRATRRITLTTLHGAAAVPPPPSSTSSGFAPLGVELGRRQ
ncbi:MAG: rpsA [Candidatus Eremiobacteraeota bacterium]|jgi:predicted RNA-binding protein with RPS1 domain|nr:rpsA [Candidatus Eremiobacteraeota bacterium]